MNEENATGQNVHGHGPILAILLVLLVLILGGLYLWGFAINQKGQDRNILNTTTPNNEPETPRANADVEILNTMSTSDNLDIINADIESTILTTLDTDLDTAEQELESIR